MSLAVVFAGSRASAALSVAAPSTPVETRSALLRVITSAVAPSSLWRTASSTASSLRRPLIPRIVFLRAIVLYVSYTATNVLLSSLLFSNVNAFDLEFSLSLCSFSSTILILFFTYSTFCSSSFSISIKSPI